jgi:ubiquinone/menaquinone biosynthesis C-methylase UbiE
MKSSRWKNDPLNYNPKIFEEDHIFDAPGLLGWLGRKRKSAICTAALSLCKHLDNFKILDAGCGYGEILSDLKGSLKVGIDINLNALKQAKQRDKETFHILCDIENLPLKAETFDFLICSEVLEHVDNPLHSVNQTVCVTKKDGFICVAVPNEWITTLGRFILNKKPYKSPAHKTVFTWTKLKKLFPYRLVRKTNIPFSFLPFFFSTNMVVIFKK